MAYIQGQAANRTAFLSLADVPVTGILYTDITVQYLPAGSNILVTKIMTSADWLEIGNGVYRITFDPSETAIVGDFTFFIMSVLFDNFLYDEFTIEPSVTPITSPLPAQCVVSGTIVNQSALPPSLLKIVARPAAFPAQSGNTILSADAVWTYADAYGNFSLALIRNSIVIIEVDRCGIRAQITVPDVPSANLIDLLPPLPNVYPLS